MLQVLSWKRNTSCGSIKWCNNCGKQCGVSWNLVFSVTFCPGIPPLRIFLKVLQTLYYREICSPMFTAAETLIAKSWKQPTCPSNEEWIKKTCYFHKIEYYLTINKNKFEIILCKWMHFETTILTEINWMYMCKYCIVFLMWDAKRLNEDQNVK